MKSQFTQLQLLKVLCKFGHYPRRYRRKQKCFVYWKTVFRHAPV